MNLKDIRLISDDSALGGTSMLWKLGIAFTFIGLVTYIVGFSTDWWCELDNEDYAPITGATINAHFGLWRKCVTIYVNQSGQVIIDKCDDMDNDDSYKPASKALCSTGLILGILALPTAILAACSHSPRGMTFGGVTTVVAGGVAMVGSIVYAAKAKDQDDRLELDYSLILSFIGLVLLIIGGICQITSNRVGYHTIA